MHIPHKWVFVVYTFFFLSVLEIQMFWSLFFVVVVVVVFVFFFVSALGILGSVTGLLFL